MTAAEALDRAQDIIRRAGTDEPLNKFEREAVRHFPDEADLAEWVQAADPAVRDRMPHGSQKGATCKLDGCNLPARLKGYCTAHGHRVRRHGDPLAHIPIRARRPNSGIKPGVPCRAAGCDRPSRTLGFCGAHYEQFRVHGRVVDGPIRAYNGNVIAPVVERRSTPATPATPVGPPKAVAPTTTPKVETPPPAPVEPPKPDTGEVSAGDGEPWVLTRGSVVIKADRLEDLVALLGRLS